MGVLGTGIWHEMGAMLRTEISTAYHRNRVGQWKRYALERLAMKYICYGTAGKAWKGGLKGRTYLYCQYTWVPPPPLHGDGNCVYIHRASQLKEKLPQAFMQIEWMENYFRNLTAKVWANLDNPIKSYDFSKFWLISCMPPSQGGTVLINICDVCSTSTNNTRIWMH